jgi:alpha-ketoglutarate-dependent taurine dioxygenase
MAMTDAGQKKTLGNIRRKAVNLAGFNPVRESQLNSDQPLPLVLEPAADQVDLADWAANHGNFIDQKLQQHGGILFRGFDLTSPADFERVANSIYKKIYGEYGDLPREGVSGKIYASTPYPDDKSILFHNEGSHMNRWPARISFFCVTAAQQGGCSPIVDCRRVYKALNPAIRDNFEQKGLMYVRNFSEGLDVSWQHFFQTEDQAVVEAASRKQGFNCEWVNKNHLRVRQLCKAVLVHPITHEKSFFNQVQLHHVHCLDSDVRQALLSIFPVTDLPRHVYYGDGSAIEDSVMDQIGEAYESNAVRFRWRKGDMVTLENMLTAHGRDPYVGPRKIVVALGDIVDSAELGQVTTASV